MPKRLTKSRSAGARAARGRVTPRAAIVVGLKEARSSAVVRLASAIARRQGGGTIVVPNAEVLEEARRVGASLIVVGIGRHRVIDRVLGHEPALTIARGTTIPVFVAAPRVTRIPRHALIATDFTDSSVRSARLVASLIDELGTITIAHVQPLPNLVRRDGVSWSDVYATGARDRLEQMQEALHEETGCRIETALLEGDTADVLLDFAERMRCDLIAVGAHVHGALDRMLIGSVTTRMIRAARCSVLVVPQQPSATPAR